MPNLSDVCRIRSKNAGPFWITIDLFFNSREDFQRYATADAISARRIAALYGVSDNQIKKYHVPELNVVKISYPRSLPQGGACERDMHGGQQFVRMRSIAL